MVDVLSFPSCAVDHIHSGCMCLTEDTRQLPAVKSPERGCSEPTLPSWRCFFLPAQSYLTCVHNSVTVCTAEVSLAKYCDIEEKFNSGSVAIDPWTHVESFGRANFRKALYPVHQSLVTPQQLLPVVLLPVLVLFLPVASASAHLRRLSRKWFLQPQCSRKKTGPQKTLANLAKIHLTINCT